MKLYLTYLLLLLSLSITAQSKMKVLIVDGQNNHLVWPKSTIMMKQYLEETGLFEIDIQRTQYLWKAERETDYLPLAKTGKSEILEQPKTDPAFSPDFEKYDVVISNFGWKAAPWPIETQKSFEVYIQNGGGFVSIHAANNSFPEWEAYNKMIGLGGWGDRTEKDGPYVYYDNVGNKVIDTSEGAAGAHGDRHHFPVTVQHIDHPITKGMPKVWMTGIDECYAKLRGPAENMTVLATGKDLSENAPTDRQEPVLMTIEYGKGRIFHNALGHDTDSFENVGFIVSFLRGTEWAASGKVTQIIPIDFPTAQEPRQRTFKLANH
ncbi:ThuA domain-containing protein [Arenibacter algicola]|uniref:ThuA domain-containing protein n=1 Tax=Arenibacter algicola TaxID=616991 RepID=UPI001C068CF1|nr:ThuA domain-containing protein [Arenibacter algicola]MBU2904139.1 ThuA domain-containing protein [Arenibacter algicola]